MDYTKKWFDFMEIANSTVKLGQIIDQYKTNIQIGFYPAFDNHSLLQLQLDNEKLVWHRTTWLKLVDTPKFNDPMESLKYTGQKIVPSIEYQNGSTDIQHAKEIIDFVKSLSLKPLLEKWGGIILDGCYYELTIGVENIATTYKWHYLPQDWTDLQKLADMLDNLNRNL